MADCASLRALLPLAKDDAGALDGVLVLAASSNVLQLVSIVDEVHGADRRVLVLTVQSDSEDFGELVAIAQRVKGGEACGLADSVAATDPSVRTSVTWARARRATESRLIDEAARPNVGEHVEGGQCLDLTGAFERFEGEIRSISTALVRTDSSGSDFKIPAGVDGSNTFPTAARLTRGSASSRAIDRMARGPRAAAQPHTPSGRRRPGACVEAGQEAVKQGHAESWSSGARGFRVPEPGVPYYDGGGRSFRGRGARCLASQLE